jgi:beta-N-acetylhexosaminidase
LTVTYESLASLTLEQQVGQILCIGVRGADLDAEARALIEEVNPGGLIVFGRNVATAQRLRALLDDFRAASPVEPILGIDQEGGLVDRLRRISIPMPAARKIREHGDLAGARTLGRVTGEMLRLFGFNLNFAPVMEIMNDERDLLSNGLYSRAFGRSPGEVMGYAMTYLRGLQKTGCWGCLKHFPGIGAGEIDSHEEIPVIRLAQEDLLAQDLAPYIELFARHEDIIRVVMISHGGFPDIDVRRGMAGGTLEPASLSKRIVTTLLREELGYLYLTVSDDLEMGAISRHCDIGEAACRSFVAGVDVLLICADPVKIMAGYHALLEGVRSGRISSDRLHEALRRIAEFKSVVQPPTPFSPVTLAGLSEEIEVLNKKLNYSYGVRS